MRQYRLVCPELGLSPTSALGGEIYDVELLTRLANMGWEIDVLVPRDRQVIQHKNIYMTRIPIRSIVPPHLFNIFVYRYLEDLWKIRPFDLIRLHNPYFVGLGALLFRRHHLSIPIVAQYHHLERATYAFFDDLFDRYSIKSWDAIVTLSRATKEEVVRLYGVERRKIHVFSAGVDQSLKRVGDKVLRRKLGLTNKKVLLFCGRLIPRKNPRFILDVLELIDRDDVTAVFAGEGPLMSILKLDAFRRGLSSRVYFVGNISRSNLSALFSLADIFLFPSFREGLGYVVLESMLCETVPISHRSTGIIETIEDGKDGYLLPLSIGAWTRTINNLLEKPSKLRLMGKAGRAKVLKNFSWDSVAEKNDQLYRSLVERKRT